MYCSHLIVTLQCLYKEHLLQTYYNMNTTSQKSLFVRAMMVLLVMLVSVTAKAETKSWSLWCKSNTTLYFVRDAKTYKPNIVYDGVKITNVWKIADANDKKKVASEKKAQWVDTAKKTCTKVVFDKSFSKARPVSCLEWFKGFTKLTKIDRIENLKTGEVKSMSYMFYNCEVLTDLDVSKFNTGNVTNMSYMFRGCASLKELDLSKFDTEKVKNMVGMFQGCSALTSLYLDGFTTTQLKKFKMNKMFADCGNLVSIFVNSSSKKWKVKTKQKKNVSRLYKFSG